MNIQNKIITLLIITIFAISPVAIVSGLVQPGLDQTEITPDRFDSQDWANGIPEFDDPTYFDEEAVYPEDFDVGSFLADNDNTYNLKWDPWKTKAAIHAIATTDDGDMMALAGGYLYDNEVHLYRWNYEKDEYDLVWEVGGGIFKSDVLSLDFADTDNNNLTELIAGGEDGRLYVFEQRHIYDPVTNMENMFDLVWTSPRLGRIFDVIVDDTDGDYRQDIIVGTGDTVRWYEYDLHGGYPFSEDHWMEFREVASMKMPSQITALGISDVNSNGLKEVTVGMRSGEIQILENNGTSLPINEYYYPIMQDNSYRSIWSSGNTIRRPISDMAGGNMDNDVANELLISVQGQGAFVLDNIDGTFGLFRLERPFDTWEANPIEIYPLDYYVDAMINSSSWFYNSSAPTVVSAFDVVNFPKYNVFYQNTSILGKFPEPLNYTDSHFIIYPYSSFSVGNQRDQPDGDFNVNQHRYTTFDARKGCLGCPDKDAWAIYDFGRHEEAAGNGISSIPDLKIWVEDTNINTENIEISISQNNVNFTRVNSSYIKAIGSDYYSVEMDPTMADADYNYYRYIKVNITADVLNIDVIETLNINNPIYDARSVEIGSMVFKNDETPTPVGFIGTIDGAILGITWNDTTNKYEVTWDSWREERWKLNTNIFDLQIVQKQGRFPAWVSYGSQSFELDFSSGAIDGGDIISYTAENFYNFRNEKNVEFIVSSSTGKLTVYTQSSDKSTPTYNAELTTQLLSGVQSYIDGRKTGSDYFTVSIIPIDTSYNNGEIKVNPIDNAYWLMLGEWHGSLGNLGIGNAGAPSPTEIEVSLWYYKIFDPITCGSSDLQECSTFIPFGKTFQSMELTGQMPGIFASSTWMPKVAGADFVGGPSRDFVLTNGKVHLLETVYSQDPGYAEPDSQYNFDLYPQDNPENTLATKTPLIQAQYQLSSATSSKFDIILKGNYFDVINEDSKGRHWTNANPVNFDGDEDFDLILGFARYGNSQFGFDKTTYGMTYWENEGSRSNPIWVEKKKAVTNNDAESNFRVANFTDPVLIYDNYDFGDKFFDIENGYHHMYRTDRPTRLLMFQPKTSGANTEIFRGKISAFYADYSHPSSLLVATYPEAKRIDINLQYINTLGSEEINYGFHIFETWDNEKELRDWTLSLATADLDEDGNNEIIVGDFNNNIYVFEHMTNNTYKRAYKSFDVNRTIETDQSPYAHDLFGGIDGTFYRTMFDHVEYLVAGFDLNQNNRSEFIAATESMIFIFEATLTPTGRIRDDTYALIGVIDLLDELQVPALQNLADDQIQISAMTWGEDITRDGRNELILGVSSALLIFEINKDTSSKGLNLDGIGDFRFEEIFFGNAYDMLGLYDIPGNYLVHPDYMINSVLVEDLDNDGFLDLVVAGTNTKGAIPLWSGFVSILEWQGSSFLFLADDEDFSNTLPYNPIYDLAVDDTDLDGLKELILGHKNGIDIYEFTADNTLIQREVITSNPHYMLPSRSYYNDVVNPFQDKLLDDKDVVRDPATGILNMAYIEYIYSTGGNRIVFANSSNDGKDWVRFYVNNPKIVESSGYSPESLSLVYDSSGMLWLGFIGRINSGSVDILNTYVVQNPFQVLNEVYIVTDQVPEGQNKNSSPRLFDITGNSNEDVIGLIYYKQQNQELHLRKIDLGIGPDVDKTVSWANGTQLGNHFDIHSLDFYQLNDGNYSLIFSGNPYRESASLDRDLFYVPFHLNNTSTFLFNYTTPNRLYKSGLSAVFPSIIQEQHTGNLLVTYEQTTLRPYGGLWAMWSNDAGITWNGPYDMSHPLGVDFPLLFEAFPTRSKESYRVGTTIGNKFITYFDSNIPVVVPGSSRGFSMVYTVHLSIDQYNSRFGMCGTNSGMLTASRGQLSLDQSQSNSLVGTYLPDQCNPFNVVDLIATAINPWSNFTWFELGSANKVVVGDSDRDGRHEILVASGNQAFLYEFAHNGAGFILHEQKWVSPEYERDLTDIAISDVNGNGFPELILESDRGIVHSYEVTNALMGQAEILYPKKEATLTATSDSSGDNYVRSIIPVDANNDGIEDFIYSTRQGQIVGIDGSDYSTMYVSGPPISDQTPTAEDLDIVYNNDTDSMEVAVLIHLLNISTYDLSNGDLLYSHELSSGIWSLTTADIIPGGYEEIIIGLANGTVIAYTGDTLSLLWSANISSSVIIRSVFVGNFASTTSLDIGIVTANGDFAVLSGSNGTVYWEKSYPAYVYTMGGNAAADFDGDGLTDLLGGINQTFAIDGETGEQIWNTTISTSNDLTPMSWWESSLKLYDIDQDGILDIIYTTNHKSGNPTIFALSGSDGSSLWEYETVGGSSRTGLPPALGDISFGNKTHQLVAFSSYTPSFGNYINNITTLMDVTSGIAFAGIRSSLVTTSSSLAKLGNDRTVVIVGDLNGEITIYSLWEGHPDPAETPINIPKKEPFFKLGPEFTRRTQYLVSEDVFKDGQIGSDGVDDIFVVDDEYIGAGDTAKLLDDPTYNLPMWQLDVPEFGHLVGPVEIGDSDGDGTNDFLVAGFSKVITAVDLKTGKFHWNVSSPYDISGVWRNLDFKLVDLDGSGDEVVLSRQIYFNYLGTIYPLAHITKISAGVMSVGYYLPFFEELVFNLADLESDGKTEILFATRVTFNPLISIFGILDADFSFRDAEVLVGAPPITEIATGDFSAGHTGDEFILFFEFNELNLPAFLYKLFSIPTLFIQFQWDGTNIVPSSSNIIGISPLGVATRNYYVTKVDNKDTFLLGQSRSGDLFSFNFTNAGVIMQNTGVYKNIAVPYARNSVLLGDFCGTSDISMVTVTAANAIACYESVDLSSQKLVWSQKIDINVIQHILAADLDDDKKTDLLIASRDGYVWVIRSSQQAVVGNLQLSEKDQIEKKVENSNEIYKIGMNILSIVHKYQFLIGLTVGTIFVCMALIVRYKKNLKIS